MTAVSAPTLPVAVCSTLDRLERVLPVEAAAARVALGQALRPVTASMWPEVVQRFSRLTNTGIPVEFAWASRDRALRWTSDVAPPESPAHLRLEAAAALATALTVGEPSAGLDTSPWSWIQEGAALRYGAWLGLRHRGARQAAKVYAELPAHAVVPHPWSGTIASLPRLTEGVTWRMAGLHVDGSVEIYARAPRLTESELEFVEGAFLTSRGLLRSAVRELQGVPGLPRPSGISVVLDRGGAPLAVTWFGSAKVLWRDDATAGRELRRRCREESVAQVYDALRRGPTDRRWRHAAVGVGADRTGATWLQAGLRPA